MPCAVRPKTMEDLRQNFGDLIHWRGKMETPRGDDPEPEKEQAVREIVALLQKQAEETKRCASARRMLAEMKKRVGREEKRSSDCFVHVVSLFLTFCIFLVVALTYILRCLVFVCAGSCCMVVCVYLHCCLSTGTRRKKQKTLWSPADGHYQRRRLRY